jgi:hypothetical protein
MFGSALFAHELFAHELAAAARTAEALPEWNLADLYPAMDSPALAADLEKADAECKAFEDTYKGKLADLLAGPAPGAALGAAVKRYEAIDDLLGRIASYGSLIYAGDTSDPARTKFYGDIQERLTDVSTHLLFFTLEMNRLDDAAIEAALTRSVDYAKINYLMLMMVDPHVHFHVIPRYEGERSAAGLTITDAGWPGQPDLGSAVKIDSEADTSLRDWLKGHFAL